MGAALLAGAACGAFTDVRTASRLVRTNPQRTPPGPAADVYPALRARYRALYPALRSEFARLGGAGAA